MRGGERRRREEIGEGKSENEVKRGEEKMGG
jgi:hypothetical protein